MAQADGLLRDIRASPVTKQLRSQIRDVHNLLGVMKDFVDERARMEREYAKQMGFLFSKFSQSSAPFKESVKMPALYGLMVLLLDQAKNTGELHDAMATSLTENVANPLGTFAQKSKYLYKKIFSDRDQAENELFAQDQKVESCFRDSESQYQKHQLAQGKDQPTVRDKMMLKNDADIERAKEVQLAHSKIAHNSYVTSVDAANAHRARLWTEEMPLLMDQLEQMILTTVVSTAQTISSNYVDALMECNTAIPDAVQKIQTVFIEGVNPNTEVESVASAMAAAVPNAVPFVQPGDRPVKPHTEYGSSLWVDEHTLYGLHHQQRILTLQMKDLQERKAVEEKKMVGVKSLADSYAGQPELGDVHQTLNAIVDTSKTLRAINLEIARTQAGLDVLGAAGINGSAMASHAFKAKAFFGRADDCNFCGDKAGGVRSVAGANARVCKTCSTAVHEGRCEEMCWTPCKDDDLKALLAALPQSAAGPRHYSTRYSVVPDSGPIPSSNFDDDEFADITDSVPAAAPSSLAAAAAVGPGRPPSAGKGSFHEDSIKVHVLYDYTPQAEDEVPGKEGDTAKILSKDDDWATVVINGKKGLFPLSYLDIGGGQGAEEEEVVGKMVAQYDYEAAADDEVSLKEGDVIKVLVTDREGWTKGRVDGRVGVFPTNYAKDV